VQFLDNRLQTVVVDNIYVSGSGQKRQPLSLGAMQHHGLHLGHRADNLMGPGELQGTERGYHQ